MDVLPWPAGALHHVNPRIYVPMQGPSESGVNGKLQHWDRTQDLGRIAVPTLTIGARFDTMDPKHMEWMAGAEQRGRLLYCAEGSHLCLYDDRYSPRSSSASHARANCSSRCTVAGEIASAAAISS